MVVRGIVQGVGFRPFVHALAGELGLAGHVANTPDGVVAEVEGEPDAVAAFVARVRADAPPLAEVTDVTATEVATEGGTTFVIRPSAAGEGDEDRGRTLVPPDVATCADCRRELADPADRRYRHPFVTCTNCGPRFTIVTGLPYDRPATTMAGFAMCDACAREYADPADRRFHAQPIACPDCGPTLRFSLPGSPDVTGEDALAAARQLLAVGAVVAVKGIGGYHLACDATSSDAVARLRKRKDRGDKPFAVLVRDLDEARRIARVDDAEAALLTGHRRPIVLLRRRAPDDVQGERVVGEVAPGNPDLGVLLAYTPLHHLLLGLPGDPHDEGADVPRVLVLTSGNVSGEPIVIDDDEARTRLADLADGWLWHDRPIHVPCDDSVVRVVDGEELPIRRSRGYAPVPVALPFPVRPALALGGDLKNTFALGDGRYAWLSAHVGDMDDFATLGAFEAATAHLADLTGVRAGLLVADKHPAYRSTRWAQKHADGREVLTVQHHHAHLAAVLAENGHDGAEPVVGFAFDGTGYGEDGAIWGGEVLLAGYDGFARYAHLRYTKLPGGDAGVRHTRRMALAHLASAGLPWDERIPSVAACPEDERTLLAQQLDRDLGCVATSSMGRLFDAVASLAGVCHHAGYEAQAAVELEAYADGAFDVAGDAYAFGALPPEAEGGPVRFDPAPVLEAVVADVLAGTAPAVVAARFHHAVVDLVVDTAEAVRETSGYGTVALSGGVFVNRLLASACVRRLGAAGFTVLRHRRVPPTDAGLALGQLAVAARAGPPGPS